MQLLEGLRDLVGLHQHVRSVQQQALDVVGPQARKACVHGTQDVVLGEVEVRAVLAKVDGAFGLQEDLVTHARIRSHGVTDELLAVAAAVDVGGVHHVDALVEAYAQQLAHLGNRHLWNAH